MRILYILTTLGIGGAEKQVVDLAQNMAAKGHAVTLLSLKHAEEEWPTQLPVLRLNLRKTSIGIARSLLFTRKFLALVRPEILHSHTYPANLFARMLRLIVRPEPKLINTIHNVYEGGLHRMFLYRLTNPLVDQITAVSQAAADRFLQQTKVPTGKLTVLTNGIDSIAFQPDKLRRSRTRAHMDTDRTFLWLAIGRIAPAKDYPNLLRAFAQVRAAQPNAQLWVAGEGDPASLEESHPIAGVSFLGLRRDIADLLDAADGYALSSAWEGMPLATAEAMSMEKPVVATDVGGVRELVGDTGMIVPPSDSNTLAQEMLKVMAMTPKARKALGQSARQRVEDHFSIQAKAETWEALYSSLIREEMQ